MFIIEDFAILALVVFTITVLLKDTDGPFDTFSKAREFLIGNEEHQRRFFILLFSCPWCVGAWISSVVNLIYVLVSGKSVVVFFAYWFASIGVTGLLYSWLYSHIEE